jgi:hypothetical protein
MDEFARLSGLRRTWLMLRATLVAALVGGLALFPPGVAFKVLGTL